MLTAIEAAWTASGGLAVVVHGPCRRTTAVGPWSDAAALRHSPTTGQQPLDSPRLWLGYWAALMTPARAWRMRSAAWSGSGWPASSQAITASMATTGASWAAHWTHA